MKQDNDRAYWVALNHVKGIGPVTFKQLIAYFKTARAIWEANEKQLQAASLAPAIMRSLVLAKQTIVPFELLEKVTSTQINPIILTDRHYPAILKEIYDPPPVLYILGEIKPEDQKAIAVIGTRKMTNYGQIATERLVQELVGEGFTIISGLARGIDATAHKQALASGGRTVAILGGGLWQIYPPEHKGLVEQIIAGHGAVISEFPPSLPAIPGNFPARNRIIAGLSHGVLVTEAAEKSGTMITVAEALDQGREVFAVPGPITSSLSVGTMNLIKQGAKLVTSVQDILEELVLQPNAPSMTEARTPQAGNQTEATILAIIASQPAHINEIVRSSQLPSQAVLTTLTLMELSGKVKKLAQDTWTISN